MLFNLFNNPLLKGYPLSYKTHVVVCLCLGHIITFHPSLILRNPLWINLHSVFGLEYVPPATTVAKTSNPLSFNSDSSSNNAQLSSVEIQHWSNIGLFISAFGLVGIAVASEPGGGWATARKLVQLRIAAGLLTAGIWVFKPESRDLVKILVMIEDGLMGLLTSWQMAS